ncbi:MAG: transglycosylase domain-containing protein, partial [Leptospirales bacterium]|nr:transglycosylase domain-containing protein [Leptospirales bacterium]
MNQLRDLWLSLQRFYWRNLEPILQQLLVSVGPALRWLAPRWKGLAVRGAIVAFVGLAGYSGVVCGIYLNDRSRLLGELQQYKQWLYGQGQSERKPPIQIFGYDGKLIGEYLPERGSRMSVQSCSRLTWLNRAAVSSEDRDFYTHGGYSMRAIARAMVNNLTSFSFREGGGTITQQLARNLFTDRSRSLFRKLYETMAARLIESELSKEEILCLYLNKIYMGEGRIGAEEASWFYFRKPPEKLSAAEAAMIVGLFPSPVAYSPLNNIQLSVKKQRLVLDALVEQGQLSERERNLSLQQFVRGYQIDAPAGDPGQVGLYGASRDFRFNAAPTANEYVKNFLHEELRESLGEDVIRAGGLRVYTTIDAAQQAAALTAVRKKVEEARSRMMANQAVDAERLERIARRLNGALISLEAGTGDIRAVVGGYGVSEGVMTQRVWSMLRQPGSSIKGFLYAVALDEGTLQVNSTVVDQHINIGGYEPRNWYRGYLGSIPLRRAVARSVNTVAVQTLHNLGVSTFRNAMISSLDMGYLEARDRFQPNLSLALGSGEVTPLELARLYALLVNGGRVIYPRLVLRVEGPEGEVLWQNEQENVGDQTLSAAACAGAIKLMQYVFDEDEDGTVKYIGRRRQSDPTYLPFPIAGKTGTVQSTPETQRRFPHMPGVRDAWFVGLTPQNVAVVWLGQDEGAPFQGSGAQT